MLYHIIIAIFSIEMRRIQIFCYGHLKAKKAIKNEVSHTPITLYFAKLRFDWCSLERSWITTLMAEEWGVIHLWKW